MFNVNRKKIAKNIKECPWKTTLYGVDTCKINALPCSTTIDSGRCQAIIGSIRLKDVEER